jgi:cell division protein FtsB
VTRLPGWIADYLPLRRDRLAKDVYDEVRAQLAPMKQHIAILEQHITDIEATITDLCEERL